jgi:Zn-finger nucleic acid-binding protein
MQCPIDGETLLMTARSGVEIDYCPRCRGVWLDRGELDKIIERSDPSQKTTTASLVSTRKRDDDDDDDDDDRKKHRSDDKRRKKSDDDRRPNFYKKSSKHASFIKELFDF